MTRKFRIFAPMLGFDPDSSLGGEIYDVEVLTRLARRGHIIDVVLRRGQKTPRMKNINIHYLPFDMKTGAFSYFVLPWLFRTGKMKRLIGKADVFRVHSPYFLGLGAALSGTRKPLWFNYHHIEDNPEMRFFDRRLPRKAHGITFVSQETEEDLKSLCRIDDKVLALAPTSIDTETFRPARNSLRRELGIGKDEKIILFVGALIKRKGIDILIKAWNDLRKDEKNHLIVIGKGPLRKMIPVERRVHYIPYAGSKEKLREYYSVADVFVFPTRLEGFGMVVGEAMACGTPVVTTNAKGVRKIVDEKTGFRVDINDSEVFAEKIRFLLENDKIRGEFGRNAIKRIRDCFNWERTVDRIEKFLEELIMYG